MCVSPDDPWAAYARTVVQIARHGEPDVIVRGAPIGERGEWPWTSGEPVHILTAWDPGTELLGEQENREREAALAAELQQLGPAGCWSAIGVDPVSGHREEGVVVRGLAEHVVRQIGARYDQDAIFSWTPSEWAIVACVGGRRVVLGWSTAEAVVSST
jgi:Protein of unknown function (DUF3293)